MSAHARESKKLFYFCTLANALRERVVFGAVVFNNRTFEGESFFNKSSVSHLKYVTAKSNSKTAVFGAVEFNNRTFERESFFNKSSVSHLKYVTAKSNSETARFILLVTSLRAIKLFSCIHVIDKDGGFPCNKDEAKQVLTHFCSAPRQPQVLFNANQTEHGYCGK